MHTNACTCIPVRARVVAAYRSNFHPAPSFALSLAGRAIGGSEQERGEELVFPFLRGSISTLSIAFLAPCRSKYHIGVAHVFSAGAQPKGSISACTFCREIGARSPFKRPRSDRHKLLFTELSVRAFRIFTRRVPATNIPGDSKPFPPSARGVDGSATERWNDGTIPPKIVSSAGNPSTTRLNSRGTL